MPTAATVPATVPADEPLSDWILTLTCDDRPGIVHAVTGAVVTTGGNIEELQQFSSRDTGRFFLRMEVRTPATREQFLRQLRPVVDRLGAETVLDTAGRRMRTLVLASKAGHCLNDLLFRLHSGQLPIEVPLVLANHDVLGDLARFYDIPFESHPIAGAAEQRAAAKRAFEERVLEVIDEERIELVVLARYMQILSPELCARLQGRAINIHHSFLPGFKGANPYKQAHERGVKLIGATAHFVTADLDEGPIIEQNVRRVDHSATVAALTEMGKDEESRTLRQAVEWFAEHRILLDGRRTIIFR